MIERKKRFDRMTFNYLFNLTASALLLFIIFYILRSGLLSQAAVFFCGPRGMRLSGRGILSESTFMTVFTYGKDFMSGYVLLSAMAFLFKDSVGSFTRALEIALIFEAGLEIVLYFLDPMLSFSLKHVFAQAAGTLTAFLMVLLIERKII